MTFNPWIGCTKVSPGCANCYAERDFDLRKHVAKWGAGQPRHRTSEAYWKQPLKWDRDSAESFRFVPQDRLDPRRPRVFCASLADWLDDEVPVEWLADLLDLIRRTPHLDWQLLTKRPENWLDRMAKVFAFAMWSPPHHNLCAWVSQWHPAYGSAGGVAGKPVPPANVWIGTTVEDQARADERIPSLLSIPARVRFLSCEPLLADVEISGSIHVAKRYFIDWVICGGESGPKARPMHPDWARSLRDQCAEAGVPFLFKQWGEWAPITAKVDRLVGSIHHFEDGQPMERVGKHAAGRLLDGREHNEFPT